MELLKGIQETRNDHSKDLYNDGKIKLCSDSGQCREER